MDTNFFDVVVCGPDFAGTITAALLSRRGVRVLLCGHDRPPHTFQAGGYTLAREPGLLPTPDAEPMGRVLRELNLAQIIRRRAPGAFPALQIVLPQHRLDLAQTPEATARELKREFPGETAAIDQAFLRLRGASAPLDPLLASDITLPADGFWERRDVARVEAQLPRGADLLAPLPAEHPLRVGLAALASVSAGIAPADVTPVALARAFDVNGRGAFLVDGGMAAVRTLFTDKISTFSGEVRPGMIPVELVWKRGRVAGLRVRPRDQTIGLGQLVWAGPTAGLIAVGGEKVGRRVREMATAVRPACFRYTVAMLVRPDGIPEGIGPRVIAIRDPGQPLLEENALQITVGEVSAREPDRVPVWVECLVPAGAAAAGTGYLAVVRGRVRQQIGRLFPFVERHLHVLASPHDGLPPELPSDRPAWVTTEPVTALPMTPVSTSDLPRTLDVGGVPHTTGIKNLWLASAETLPGLGREGEFVTAWGTLRLLGAGPARESARRDIIIEDV